jgi:hypothetical protein
MVSLSAERETPSCFAATAKLDRSATLTKALSSAKLAFRIVRIS